MKQALSFLLFGFAFLTGGCLSVERHVVDHSWREQHLFSITVDHVVGQLPTDLFIPGPIAVRVSTAVRDGGPFIENAIRARLVLEGFPVSVDPVISPPTQVLQIVISAAAAETIVKTLLIPLPIPFITSPTGLPLWEKVAYWSWVELGGTLTSATGERVLARISKVSARVHLTERTYLGVIGPFRTTNLAEDDPAIVLDWD